MKDFLKNAYLSQRNFALALLLLVILLMMIPEIANDRFKASDFRVYVTAAERLLSGENLYRPEQDGHYYYKYSPTAAIYFLPYTAIPYVYARAIYWIFLTLIFLLGCYMCISLVRPWYKELPPKTINNVVLIVTCIIGVKLQRELHLGQVNHLLLLMYIGMIYLWRNKRELFISLLWAMALFLKPHCLIFLPYFLVKKKFKIVAMFLVFAAVLFIAPSVFMGFDMAIDQQQLWFHELAIDLGNKQDMLGDGNLTIFAALAKYTPMRLVEFTPLTTHVYQAIVLALLCLLVLYLIFKGHDINDAYVFEMAFLTGLIPLIASTGRNAFGFLEIVVFLIIFNWGSLNRWMKWTAVIGFILFGGFMHDMVGNTLWMFWFNNSLLAVGAIMILIVAVNLRVRKAA